MGRTPRSVFWFCGAVALGLVGLGGVALVGVALTRRPPPRAESEPAIQSAHPVENASTSDAAEEAERKRKLEIAHRRFDAREQAESSQREERNALEGEASETATTVAAEPRPTETRGKTASPEEVRAALSQISVELYSAPWCRYCNQARAFLQQNQVRFREFDVDADPAAKAHAKSLNPRGGVPVIQIEDEVLVGFSSESVANSLAKALERRTGVPVRGTLSK